jgi:hypothetical protein
MADLFGMLQERKEEVKVKAQETKAAKAKAKAPALVGAGLVAVVAVEAPKPAKHGKTGKKRKYGKKGKQLKVKDEKTPEVCEATAVALAEAVAKSGVVCKAKAGAKAVALAKAGAWAGGTRRNSRKRRRMRRLTRRGNWMPATAGGAPSAGGLSTDALNARARPSLASAGTRPCRCEGNRKFGVGAYQRLPSFHVSAAGVSLRLSERV